MLNALGSRCHTGDVRVRPRRSQPSDFTLVETEAGMKINARCLGLAAAALLAVAGCTGHTGGTPGAGGSQGAAGIGGSIGPGTGGAGPGTGGAGGTATPC